MTGARGNVITFYSYKGGTGRTMAVANTGYALAGDDRGEVLMIDWDLEAPGLPDFFPELSEEGTGKGEARVGVLELFEDALRLAREQDGLGVEDARRFWRDMDLPARVEQTEADGLCLLRSGLVDETYGDRVRSMPWQTLFECWPDLFQVFAEEIASAYRYVLIDSRTGLSDTSGICTSLLPDRLVAVFTPNRQSLAGVTEIVRRAVAYRGRSSDLRRLLVFPLASRVEMSEDRLRHEWRYGSSDLIGYQPRFQRLFTEIYDLSTCDLESYFDEVQVQHATGYAYGERVAMRDEDSDRLSLARSYERFTRALLQPDGPWTFGQAGSWRAATTDEGDAAGLVLGELEKVRTRHVVRARREKQIDTTLILGAGTVLMSGLGLYLGLSAEGGYAQPFAPWIGSILVIAGVLLGARFLFAPHRRYVLHVRAANALERESTLFRAKAGPYAGIESPVALLAERVAERRAEIDDALLDPGGKSQPTF